MSSPNKQNSRDEVGTSDQVPANESNREGANNDNNNNNDNNDNNEEEDGACDCDCSFNREDFNNFFFGRIPNIGMFSRNFMGFCLGMNDPRYHHGHHRGHHWGRGRGWDHGRGRSCGLHRHEHRHEHRKHHGHHHAFGMNSSQAHCHRHREHMGPFGFGFGHHGRRGGRCHRGMGRESTRCRGRGFGRGKAMNMGHCC